MLNTAADQRLIQAEFAPVFSLKHPCQLHVITAKGTVYGMSQTLKEQHTFKRGKQFFFFSVVFDICEHTPLTE